MAVWYTCKQDETLDLICWRHYGQQSQVVEYVLSQQENAGLADKGEFYEAGFNIYLPDLPVELTRPQLTRKIQVFTHAS